MAEKIRGFLNHSSILSGGATLYSGYISLHKGEIDKASPLSGHYLPSNENFIKFLKLLQHEGIHIDFNFLYKKQCDHTKKEYIFYEKK